MKKEESIDRVIQVKDVDIGKNIAKIRKAMNIKQKDMVARLQTNGVDISIYSYNRIEKVHKIQPYYSCMPVAAFLTVIWIPFLTLNHFLESQLISFFLQYQSIAGASLC